MRSPGDGGAGDSRVGAGVSGRASMGGLASPVDHSLSVCSWFCVAAILGVEYQYVDSADRRLATTGGQSGRDRWSAVHIAHIYSMHSGFLWRAQSMRALNIERRARNEQQSKGTSKTTYSLLGSRTVVDLARSIAKPEPSDMA